MNYVSTFEPTLHSVYNLPALFIVYSNLTANQLIVAHEVYHKPDLLNKVIGLIAHLRSMYLQFPYEHLYGHHRKVATL